MRAARLPAVKTLADFDLSFEPSGKRDQVERAWHHGAAQTRHLAPRGEHEVVSAAPFNALRVRVSPNHVDHLGVAGSEPFGLEVEKDSRTLAGLQHDLADHVGLALVAFGHEDRVLGHLSCIGQHLAAAAIAITPVPN